MSPPPADRGHTAAARLLGRARECAVLDRAASDVVAGRSRVLVLRGDPGAGKSALLRYFSEQVHEWRVLRATGVESELELAYSGLNQLFAPVSDHLADLPVPQRDALETVFGRRPGPPPDRFLVALASLSLVAELAEEGPVTCIVEDAQWLDRASTQVLAFAARRLSAERVALICAARTGEGDDVLAGMPQLQVRGLTSADARALLLANLYSPLDASVTDRIVAECQGNPLALLELPRNWTAAELAGGFGLPDGRPVARRVQESYVERLSHLPLDTQLLVLTAAAEPLGDPGLLRRAVGTLGIDMSAVEPAAEAGLLQVGRRVAFAHPLVRSAAYRSAHPDDRLRVHAALTAVTDAEADPDRHAWHRSCATRGPDEEVAAELERSAGRAQARGGLAAAAAFLTRASGLTPQPATRARRALDAARANVGAGALETARRQLAVAAEGPLDDLQRARTDLLRAQLALVTRRGNEAAPLLLAAARRLEPLDPDLARDTYLDAFSAAQFAARLNDGVDIAELARAARRAPLPPGAGRTARDLVLQAFAALTDDYPAAVPAGREALARLLDGRDPAAHGTRLLWQGSVLALELWDDEAAYALSHQHLQTVRRAGALSELPLALSSFIPILVFRGELSAAAGLVEGARSVQQAAGITETAYGALTYLAWRGEVPETRRLVRQKLDEATSRHEGIGIAVCEYARAVLCNGLGRYDEAVAAAVTACADPTEPVVHNWGLAELIEAAARSGRTDLATGALQRLTAKARASGTDWALGTEARARALLGVEKAAEGAFGEAIDHLGRSGVRSELARAHLLYGEWLRRADRPHDARRELGLAHEMFTATGLDGFAQRARRELLGTGATVGRPAVRREHQLTAQEAHIARLARDGLSNPEIGAQLFISARTVEWHLHKVFAKLGISSRRELQRALQEQSRTPRGS